MFLGSRAWPAHKADHLSAICELIVWTVWSPQHLTAIGLRDCGEYLLYSPDCKMKLLCRMQHLFGVVDDITSALALLRLKL
jgi:hypothetical protein